MCHGKDGSNIQVFKLKRISLTKCNREELLGFLDYGAMDERKLNLRNKEKVSM